MTEYTLRTLLMKAQHIHNGASGRQLGHLANRNGHKITHTTINAILNNTYKSQPGDDTIRAIAWLANVPDYIAFHAAGRKAGLKPFADDLPPGVDELTPKERAAVLGLLRMLVAQRRALNEAGTDG